MAEENKKTSAAKSSGDEGAIPPVIDLRELEEGGGSAASSAASGATSGAAASAGGGQTVKSPVPPPAKKQAGISLEEEALMAQAQTVIAPPAKYVIPTAVKEKFPDLEQLIIETESMNDEERNYWFQILPIMTEDQINKFRDILINEKTQLKRLDTEYEQEISRLNQKHIMEWREFETKEKRKAIQTAEEKAQKEEEVTEEELLKRLSQP